MVLSGGPASPGLVWVSWLAPQGWASGGVMGACSDVARLVMAGWPAARAGGEVPAVCRARVRLRRSAGVNGLERAGWGGGGLARIGGLVRVGMACPG
ncbi:hypothetical protein [Kribbella sp. NPDC051718]|uniref:hypothetical protein n=1 Tax=Kribbella sp. NPDC051718 TaxID=3155168 RepID=UPI003434E353